MHIPEAGTQINARTSTVCEILADAGNHAVSESGIIAIEGDVRTGSIIWVRTTTGGDRRYGLRVQQIPGEVMTWTGGVPLGLFKNARTFTLSSHTGMTHLRVTQEHTGPLNGLLAKPTDGTQRSFIDYVEAAKARAELFGWLGRRPPNQKVLVRHGLTGPVSARGGRPTLGTMDSRSEISSFLTTRRAKLTPEQAGVPLYSGGRRVPGLRREEVAHLAGVSVDYYARLERGRISGASREVMDAIARALQLDDDERDHLLDLARITQRRTPRRKPSNRTTVRPGIQSVLDSIDAPAFVQNARLDRLASNRIGRALYSLPHDGSGDRFNYAHYLFLDSRAPGFHRDFDTAKHNVVALLHAATARDPYDRELIEIIGTLSTQSQEFRTLWASHDVFRYRSGQKMLTHSAVGDLEFGYESFELSTDPGLVMLVYTVEPGSATADAMRILASWATPQDQMPRPSATHATEAG